MIATYMELHSLGLGNEIFWAESLCRLKSLLKGNLK